MHPLPPVVLGALQVLRLGVPWPFLAGRGGQLQGPALPVPSISSSSGDSTAGAVAAQVSISHPCCQLLTGGRAVWGQGSEGASSQLVAVARESAEGWHMSTPPSWYLGRTAALAVVARHRLLQASSWLSHLPYARFLYSHPLGGTVLPL